MKVIQPVTSQYMSIKQQASKVHAPSTNKAQTKLDIEYITRFELPEQENSGFWLILFRENYTHILPSLD